MLGKPSRLSCTVLVAAILSCILTPSAGINYNHVCALVPDNSYIASKSACDIYYSCYNGIATQQLCAPGMSFNVQQQQCVPSGEANCFLNQQDNPCEGRPIGSWAPVPGSCQSFYYCSPTGPMKSACPSNQNFDAINQMCDYIPCSSADTTGSSESSGEDSTGPINLCNFIQAGMYFGSAVLCSGWSICQNGQLKTGVCNTGFMYNTNRKMCDYPSAVSCIQVTNDPELIPAPSSSGGACNTTGNIAVPNTCNAYYTCTNNYLVLNYCPSGEYYDTVSQACVPRMMARNNCNRCQGTTASFVNAYSQSNCTGYLYCQNGIEKSSGFCANGAYFDEELGGCAMEVEPQYGCCNPSAWSTTTTVAPSGNSTTVTGSSDTTPATGSSDTTPATNSSDTTPAPGSSDTTPASGSSDTTSATNSSDTTPAPGSSDTTS